MTTYVYDICYSCDECEGAHMTGARVRFTDWDRDGQSVSVAFAGQELSSNIKVIQEPDKLRRPKTNRPTFQPDLNKIFLSLANN